MDLVEFLGYILKTKGLMMAEDKVKTFSPSSVSLISIIALSTITQILQSYSPASPINGPHGAFQMIVINILNI